MRRREILAATVAALIGVPLIYMMGQALAEGLARHEEATFQSVLGRYYEPLREGDETPYHYLAPRDPGERLAAPDFALPDREGNTWRLADHRGKTVVLNFWSITCPPCVQEMPTLEELARMAREWDDVEVVAVSTDDGWDEAGTVLSEDTPLTVLFDPERDVVQGQFGSRLFPETWIIDPKGVIRFRYDGARDWADPLTVDLVDTFR